MASFVSYIFKTFFKTKRSDRFEIKVPCHFLITPKNPSLNVVTPFKLRDGVLINYSTKGLGIITTPAIPEINFKNIVPRNSEIYVEFEAPDMGTKVKLQGQVRWIKNHKNFSKPYSEMGMLVLYVQDDSKTELFSKLFNSQEK